MKEIFKNSNIITIEEDKNINLEYLSNEINIDKDILKYKNNWYFINNKWYYFKHELSLVLIINELLGSKLAKYFDLDTIDYKIGNVNGKIGLLSENFRKNNLNYLTLKDLKINPYQTTKNKFKLLRNSCNSKENYLEFLKKTRREFILDFYSGQVDRKEDNLTLTKDKKGYLDMAPLIDFEASFNNIFSFYSTCLLKINLNKKEDINYLKNDLYINEQIYKVMDIIMNKLLTEIEEENNFKIPNDIKNIYLYHDTNIKELIKTKIL